MSDEVNGLDDPLAAEADAEAAASKKPVEVTAEDLADEEWGPVKEKVKKGKKGKGKKGKAADESEDEAKIGGFMRIGVDFGFTVSQMRPSPRRLQPQPQLHRLHLQKKQTTMTTSPKNQASRSCRRRRRRNSRKSVKRYGIVK